MSLAINNLTIYAGDFSLTDITIAIPTGKCAVLMGRSGSGKTTLMEALCGLRKVTNGQVLLGGSDITHVRPCERGIGLVPQDTVLFPHLTVREHLEFGPQVQKWSKKKIAERLGTLAVSLGVEHLLDRKPQGLSGGEAKRVSIGRAIAGRPQLLCLDESLTGLDSATHEAMMELLKKVTHEENLTTLHITHREEESQFLGDHSYLINDGVISSCEDV